MYLQDMQGIWDELDQAYSCYDQLGTLIHQMREFMIQQEDKWTLELDAANKLAQVLMEAKALEEQAVNHFRVISLKFPDRKRSTVPRWGAHSAR
ncbi:hypothetical protein D3C76_1465380 [compost metagenome]